MNDQLFIPTKLKVGYQKRSDTYSKKLAYVIYYDQKGVLRKEGSWESWRSKSMGSDELENVPTEGFVLNRDVGGVRRSWSSWNPRMEKVRVFDPRGFEIEITIPNLLFILQECTSTKGKGLEGEFVYAWSGTELMLIPVSCEEYKNSVDYTSLQAGKVAIKDLIPGILYRTKRQSNLVYIGKYNWFRFDQEYNYKTSQYDDDIVKIYSPYIFQDEKGNFLTLGDTKNLSIKVTDTPIDDLADRIVSFAESENSDRITGFIEKPVTFEFSRVNGYYKEEEIRNVFRKEGENTYRIYTVTLFYHEERSRSSSWYRSYEYNNFKHATISSKEYFFLKEGELVFKNKPIKDEKEYSQKEIEDLGFLHLEVELKRKKTKKLKY